MRVASISLSLLEQTPKESPDPRAPSAAGGSAGIRTDPDLSKTDQNENWKSATFVGTALDAVTQVIDSHASGKRKPSADGPSPSLKLYQRGPTYAERFFQR
jgi:hypothetical protein